MFGKEQSAASCRAIDLGGPLPWLGRWGCWEGPCAHPFLFPSSSSSSGVPCHCSGCGFGCVRCCPDAVLCDLPSSSPSSSRLRPVNGPAEELRQAAAGCPPVSEEPDEPGEEVLLRPVSVARHQGRALGLPSSRPRQQPGRHSRHSPFLLGSRQGSPGRSRPLREPGLQK